jgi:soluble lytic murein transglycosylase-like protein
MRQLAIAGALALACLTTPALAGSRTPLTHRSTQPLQIRPARAGMADLVLAAARRHGVPRALAYGVASVESGFNPRARSGAGALGLMQLMPATARDLGCRGSLLDPATNADCGARYLALILRDQRGDIRRTAALYNQGRFGSVRAGARYAAMVIAHGRRISA